MHKMVEPLILVRKSSLEPRVFPHHIVDKNFEINDASETVDLLNVLSCFNNEQNENKSSYVPTQYHLSYSEEGTEQLRGGLLKRMGVKPSTQTSTKWPLTQHIKREKKTLKRALGVQLTELDMQLSHFRNSSKRRLETDNESDSDVILDESYADVVTFDPKVKNGSLMWSRKVADISTSGSNPPQGCFRQPAPALQKLVHSRLFLLDDHCLPCKVGSGRPVGPGRSSAVSAAAARGSSSNGSSKALLLRSASQRLAQSGSVNSTTNSTTNSSSNSANNIDNIDNSDNSGSNTNGMNCSHSSSSSSSSNSRAESNSGSNISSAEEGLLVINQESVQPAEEKDNESVGEGGGELDDAVQGAPDKAVEQVEVAANKETADEDGDEDVVHEADTAVEEVEAVLACHAEALTDAVLELVFKYARSKKVEAQSALSSSARGHKVSAPGENSIGGGSGAINTGGRPKKTQKVKLEQPAIIPSYTWRDVLEAVRVDRGESVKVHQDLPALHLTEEVRTRTELRLRALMGSTPAPSAPSIVGNTPLPSSSSRIEGRRPKGSREAGVETGAETDEGGRDSKKRSGSKKNKFGKLVPASLLPVVWDASA